LIGGPNGQVSSRLLCYDGNFCIWLNILCLWGKFVSHGICPRFWLPTYVQWHP
jgi:hypothetical protein